MAYSLSVDDCTKILQNKLRTKDVQFVSFEIKPISENVEGLLGNHSNLLITYKLNGVTKTDTFFMKTKPIESDYRAELSDEHNAYKKEIFVFETLFEEFDKYGFKTNFAGKCYYSVPEKTLIFENLIQEGYVSPNTQAVFTMDQIKTALKSLALFHAAGFAYQETKSKEMGSFSFEEEFSEYLNETFFVFYFNTQTNVMKIWKRCMKSIDFFIDLLPKDETYKKELKSMFNNYPYGKIFVDETKLAKTLGHSDLWCNNMMFKYENEKVIDCRIVDYQLFRYFHPSFDVTLLIFLNTDAEFRRTHLDELYEYYYAQLDDILADYGHPVSNILPKEDFLKSIRLTKVDVLLQVLCAIILLYLPKKILTDTLTEDGGSFKNSSQDNNSNIYDETFLKNEKYRKRVSDAIYDIRNALLEMK